jgi:hypothetical protein
VLGTSTRSRSRPEIFSGSRPRMDRDPKKISDRTKTTGLKFFGSRSTVQLGPDRKYRKYSEIIPEFIYTQNLKFYLNNFTELRNEFFSLRYLRLNHRSITVFLLISKYLGYYIAFIKLYILVNFLNNI